MPNLKPCFLHSLHVARRTWDFSTADVGGFLTGSLGEFLPNVVHWMDKDFCCFFFVSALLIRAHSRFLVVQTPLFFFYHGSCERIVNLQRNFAKSH